MFGHQIIDGHNLRGTVEAFGPYPGFSFDYRVRAADFVDEAWDKLRRNPGKARAKVVAEVVKDTVTAWTATDTDGGETVPVTLDTIKALPHAQRKELLAYALQERAGREADDGGKN